MNTNRLTDNLWLLRVCQDVSTWRAMKGRLHDESPLRRLCLRGLPGPISCGADSTDIAVVWELFRGREYALVAGPWAFRTVLDCGANIGVFLAWVVSSWGRPPGRYVGVEPDPDCFPILCRQVESLGVERVAEVIQAAVWDRTDDVPFDNSGPSWSHCVGGQGNMRVRAITVEGILDQAGLAECDLLKLDIEGAEMTVLPTITRWASRVKVIVAELHGSANYQWFRQVVESVGFRAYPAGALFLGHPSAVRLDAMDSLGMDWSRLDT